MFRLILIAALVALTLGQKAQVGAIDDHCCSFDDRHMVMDEWNEIWNTPDSAFVKITISQALFDRLLAEHPDATALFSNVHVDHQSSGEWKSHMLRVMGGVDVIMNLMDDVPAMRSEIEHLAGQHRARPGITKAHFESFLRIMMDEFPKVMTHFNGDAWRACLTRFFMAVGGHS